MFCKYVNNGKYNKKKIIFGSNLTWDYLLLMILIFILYTKNSTGIEKFGFAWYNYNKHKNEQFEL